MICWLVISLVVSFAMGWLTVSLLYPVGAHPSSAQLCVKVFVSIGVGQGITACLTFLYLLINGRVDGVYLACELLVLGCLGMSVYLKRTRSGLPSADVDVAREDPHQGSSSLVSIAFYATAAIAFSTIALGLWHLPHGAWDAWMTWNLRARAIFRGGDAWREGFSSLVINPDYPLMLPLAVARAWTYIGSDTVLAPATLSWLFAAAVVGLVMSAVAVLSGRMHGYIAGVVLLAYSFFVAHASSQMPELPLMFFYAAALVLCAIRDEKARESGGMLVLAGLAVGLAVWTKNEGLLFLGAFALAHFLVVTCTRGFRAYLKQVLLLAAGLVPVLALVIYFKTQVAPPTNLYISRMTAPQVSAQLMDADRYAVIAREFGRRFFLYNGLGINMIYILLIFVASVGITRRRILSVIQGALVLALMMGGFVFIYLATNAPAAAVMRDSIDRVLVQLWPAFVFVFFLLAAPLQLPSAGRQAAVRWNDQGMR